MYIHQVLRLLDLRIQDSRVPLHPSIFEHGGTPPPADPPFPILQRVHPLSYTKNWKSEIPILKLWSLRKPDWSLP
jgi:hypothetical protein